MFGALLTRIVDFDDDLYRNIYGIRVSQNLFDDIGDDEGDFAVAAAAERPRQRPGPSRLVLGPFDYGTVVTYPFAPDNWHGTRYSDGTRFGVWYGSLAWETTVYETVYHAHRFLADSFPGEERPIRSDRRVFTARCRGILVDLRGRERDFPGLVDRRDYGFTQRVGDYLERQRQNGLLAPSSRCEGVNGAVLRPELLSDVRDFCYLTYRISPASGMAWVEREPGSVWTRLDARALG